MKRPGLRAALAGAVILLGLQLAGAVVFVSAGFAPVKASPGHWAPTRALLQVAKRRAVATQSALADAPRGDESWRVLKGAGHYETGCRPCHGSPGSPRPVVATAMTPAPPELGAAVGKYDAAELFFIVKHGLKFTGMPAWPSLERDDEVGAMVEFLLEYPRLDERRYQRLVYGDTREARTFVPPVVAASCARCHGVDGLGRGQGAFPKLGGQRVDYLLAALRAYSNGDRHSGIMRPLAAVLTPAEQQQAAEYYAGLEWPAARPAPQSDPRSHERGREIATRGVPDQRIPPCRECHGPKAGPHHPFYPYLAGQYRDYLELQLELLESKKRGGSSYAHVMQHVAIRLSQQQIADVATYYAALPPQP